MMNDDKTKKIRASYQFFQKMQNEKTHFSVGDIESATGWNSKTIKTYKSKKWSNILRRHSDNCFSADISAYTEEAYVRMMSQNYKQSVEPFKPVLQEQVEELVAKARDSAILAIDIYNRPIALFRSQGYIIMMIIAWTSLLHAIFESEETDYFYTNKDGSYVFVDGDKKAWDLENCLKECGNLILHPVKQNLRLFISLRNKIEHRYVPEFDFDIFGECQAMLLNFESLITEKFGSYYALNNSLSFPLHVSTVRSDAQSKTLKKIQSKHYKELRDYIEVYRNSLDDNVFADDKYSFRVFLIPQVGNHRSSSDFAVEFIQYDPEHTEVFESIKRNITLVKEKCVPVANQGKLRPQMVCDALSKKLDTKISIFLHTKAWKYYKVRGNGKQAKRCNPKYCQYDEAHRDYVYTQDWVDFLSVKFSDPDELQKVKNQK